MENRRFRFRWRQAIEICLVSLLFSGTAVLIAPLHVQTTNQLEFAFTSGELLKALFPAFIFCLISLVILLVLLKGQAYRLGLSIIFMFSLLLWLQGNFFVWDYGPMDGREIDWKGMWYFGVFDSSIWLLGLLLAIRHEFWFTKKHVITASIALLLIQTIGTYYEFAGQVFVERYRADDSRSRFVYSSQKNVFIIVVDAFQTDVFQEVIDRDSGVSEVFDGFVYFRNAVSAFRESFPSVPNILTGTYFDNSQPMWDYLRDAYLGESSLPKYLKERGYRSEVYEQKLGMYFDPAVVDNVVLRSESIYNSQDVLKNLDFALFCYVPHFVRKLVYNNQLWLLSRWFSSSDFVPDREVDTVKSENYTDPLYVDLRQRPPIHISSQDSLSKLFDLRLTNKFVNYARIGYEKPAFKFNHMSGIHLPIRMNRNLEYVEPEGGRESLIDLSLGIIKLIDLILDSYRELGIFDDSLIIITADHGLWGGLAEVKIPSHITKIYGENGIFPASSLPESKGAVLPLILIKRIDATGKMSTNDAPVALADIPKTVVSELGFDADSFFGESMFELKANQPRKRFVHFSTLSNSPPYTGPYRSTMTEFVVEGFSWLDKSWKKTGKEYPPSG